MRDILSNFLKNKKLLVLSLILILLSVFLLGNVLLLVNQEKAPKIMQKVIVSEVEFSQKVLGVTNYESEVPGARSSCGG